jgi:hypothetical protein
MLPILSALDSIREAVTITIQFAHRIFREPNQKFDKTSTDLGYSEPKIFFGIMSLTQMG